jgi:hypothetical protein
VDPTTEATTGAAEGKESDDTELTLEIKVLRTKVRTSLRGGTCRTALSGPGNPT